MKGVRAATFNAISEHAFIATAPIALRAMGQSRLMLCLGDASAPAKDCSQSRRIGTLCP
jgi:hypothetical protein